MKKNFLFLTAALFVLAGAVSCNKSGESASYAPETNESKGMLNVRIGVPEEETKALANIDNVKDFRINSVQVFVFNHNGHPTDGSDPMETDYYYVPDSPVSSDISVTVNTTTGTKIIYVVVNRNRMYRERGVSYTLADFEDELADLSENTFSGLLMVGKNEIDVEPFDKNVNPSQAAQEMEIYVRRMVAMVKLSGITVDFSHSSLSGGTFQITGMYLKNAVGRARMALNGYTDAPGDEGVVPFMPLSTAQYNNGNNWYNKMTLVSGCPAVLLDNGCSETCNTTGTTTSINRCLFAFPNATSADSFSTSSTWVARHTRLTIKANVECHANDMDSNEETFYTFTLPPLESNKVYNIQNIHITQMGKPNDNTDTELSGGQLTPVISVDAWDSDVINLTYEF